MELQSKDVLEILKEGINMLYLANTVRTSRAFLHRAHLLSCGVMDESGLEITAQKTDASDRALDLQYYVRSIGAVVSTRRAHRPSADG